MSKPPIEFDNWSPISPDDLPVIMRNAKFSWCLAGGFALERHVGEAYRNHSDIDIIVFRDDQLTVQQYFEGWVLYVADPPGSLRTWLPNEFLPEGVHDIWGYRKGAESWELQIMLQESEGESWYYRRNHSIRGSKADYISDIQGLPCIRVAIQLLYKSKNIRDIDQEDFSRCVPLLDESQRSELRGLLARAYPEGHAWLRQLAT